MQAIEIAKLRMPVSRMWNHPTTKPDIKVCGIRIPVQGTDAAIALSGRLSLEQLGRIIAACEGSSDHAQA